MLTTLSDLSDQGMSSCDPMLISCSWSLQWRHSSDCAWISWCVSWVTRRLTLAQCPQLIMSQCHKDVPYLAVWSNTDDIASSPWWWCDHVLPPGSLCRVITPSLAPFKHLTPWLGPVWQCVTPAVTGTIGINTEIWDAGGVFTQISSPPRGHRDDGT